MSNSLCGSIIQSRRGLLAFIWSLVTLLTMISFIVALFFTISAKNMDEYYNDQDDAQGNREGDEQEIDPEIAVTSRAMAFAALWTAVLACLMSVFGTVILGFQSPTGQYYTCCAGNVHKTTPLGLGSFIGALLMFANLTLVCSVLFGEFEVRLLHVDEHYFTCSGDNLMLTLPRFGIMHEKMIAEKMVKIMRRIMLNSEPLSDHR